MSNETPWLDYIFTYLSVDAFALTAIFSALPTLIEAERAALSASDLSPADIAAGKAMLAEAEKRAKKKDRDVLRAILTGYTYFLIATGREASTADKLLSVWEELQ